MHQSSINSYKARVLSDRMTKFYELKHVQPKTVLIGTSRAGLFPSRQLLPYATAPVYNLSLAGSSIQEQSRYLEYALRTGSLETVVWSLDLFAFNPDKPHNISYQTERLEKEIYWPDITNSMLSFKTVEKSINTIKDSLRYNGDLQTHLYERTQYITMQGQGFTPAQIQENIKRTLAMYRSSSGFLKSEGFKQKDSIDSSLQAIRKIASLCDRRGVKLHVYFSPIHEEHLNLIYTLGLENTYLYCKREVADITSYTDFSLLNSVTKNSANFRDSSHVTSDIGPLIFARIFNKKLPALPKDFGKLVKKSSVGI